MLSDAQILLLLYLGFANAETILASLCLNKLALRLSHQNIENLILVKKYLKYDKLYI